MNMNMNMNMKKCAYFLGAVITVMSSSVFAETTGAQSFAANITANTCTVTGLNQTRDLGNLYKSQFATAWAASPVYNNDFNVANCPTTFTKVKVTPTYTTTSGFSWVVDNAGTAKGLHLNTQADSATAKGRWSNGTPKEFALNNGAAVVPLSFKIERNDTSTVSDGTLDFQMTFAFDFE